MTAQQMFKAEYRTARLYARREMTDDGVAYVKPDPRKAGLQAIFHPTDSDTAIRAATRAYFLRGAKDKLPSKFETVFFAAIYRKDYYVNCWDEVFGNQSAADFYKKHREAA